MIRTSNFFDLTDKVVLITGGAGGLGSAIGRAFAEHGAVVVLSDIDGQAAEEVAGEIANAAALACDVADVEQVNAMVAAVIAEHGRLDVLVNNAGVHRRVDPLAARAEDVEAQMAVNLRGCLNCCGAVGRVMLRQEAGSIINVSAVGGGLVGLGRGGSAYGMTKGGVVALTRDLAAEWSGRGIRVNALAPGWIRTPMTSELQADATRAAKVLERVPLGRWGEPAEVAGAAVFLASEAAAYIAGHVLPVDGGATSVIALSSD